MARILPFVIFIICVNICSSIDDTRSQLSTYDRIRKDGYPSEKYDLITSDGYILQINRIPRGKNDYLDFFRQRPVVFLQHGLQSSASSFLGIGVNSSLAYYLADSGFDVWIGNARGVKNSRRHLFLSPDNDDTKRQFWDFSFEEVALIDLPHMIDFALSRTRQKKLHYVGHSQGGTVFLILNSRKPEYNDKIASAHLLAGVGYQNDFPNWVLSQAAARTDDILALTSLFGFVEILAPPRNEKPNLGELIESVNNMEIPKNKNDLFELIYLIMKTMEEISRAKESVSGAAVKQYAHYGQNIRDKSFRSFDHGLLGNLLKYGRYTPPEYDLKNIKVNMTMHYTLGDILLHERDVLAMAEVIPNCKVRKVARKDFSHTDFLLARDTRELVFDYLIDDLKRRK
ncbi:lipase 3-like [Pieris napi]|uniref:lipase 3-like n=1 Tax=Pieris napi TaxID=78633 RepID=UPI001FB95A85|nr:lipase 3-like [Pieris napi]